MTTVAVTQSAASFRAEREGDWRRLEGLLGQLEGRSSRALSADDLLALPVLYRQTLSSLSMARATTLDRALIDYLEALSLRAYFVIYGTGEGAGARLARFFRHDWPRAVRAIGRETLVATFVLAIAAVAGFLLVRHEPQWFGRIVGSMAQGRGPDASADELRRVLYTPPADRQGLKAFATFLFTHNAQLSLMGFALGFAFGIPTLMLLFDNGALLGAFLEVYWAKGLALPLIGWLSIHGTTELFALILSSAAGLHIGTRIAFPGVLTRIAAARAAGRTSAAVMVGVVLMLAVAGLLEGIARQVVNVDSVRFAVGLAMLTAWIGYFYGVGLRRRGRRRG